MKENLNLNKKEPRKGKEGALVAETIREEFKREKGSSDEKLERGKYGEEGDGKRGRDGRQP